MKRQHLLLSVILASATLSFGQDQNRGLVLEASGSLGVSKLVPAKVDLKFGEMKSAIKPVFSGGITVGYMFSDRLGIFTGATIAKYSYRVAPKVIHQRGTVVRIDGRTTFFEMPLSVRYLNTHNRYAWYGSIGARGGLFLNGKTHYLTESPISAWNYSETIDQKENNIPIYNTISLSPFIDFGIRIPIGNLFYLHAGPEISYQVTNIFNRSYISSIFKYYIYNGGNLSWRPGWEAYYLNAALKISIGLKRRN